MTCSNKRTYTSQDLSNKAPIDEQLKPFPLETPVKMQKCFATFFPFSTQREPSASDSLAPALLPGLPVFTRLSLGASPLLLDLFELSLPLFLDLWCRAAQADEELAALELFGQSHSCPLARVFCSESSDFFNIGFLEMVLLLVDWSHWRRQGCGGFCGRGSGSEEGV